MFIRSRIGGLFTFVVVSMFAAAFAEVCPHNGSTFSMVYPAKIIVISENKKDKEPHLIPSILVDKILEELGASSPKIIFAGTRKTFDHIRRSLPDKTSQSRFDDKLILNDVRPAQFQQDVFETFYDSKNRSTLVRQFQGYAPINDGPNLTSVPALLKRENISAKLGDPVDQQGAWVTGVGGNVESTSFGLNLLGSGEFTPEKLAAFKKDLFGDSSAVVFDTSWLSLGHIDEILVEIKSAVGPVCASTFLINSPELGLSVQKKNKPSSSLNRDLQKKFDAYKTQLTTAAQGRCKIEFVDVPIIYKEFGLKNKKSLYATTYPSFTNGLLIENRYFLVESGEADVNKLVEAKLAKIGLKVVWLPLLSHLYTDGFVDGYAHCLTNTIRTCRP